MDRCIQKRLTSRSRRTGFAPIARLLELLLVGFVLWGVVIGIGWLLVPADVNSSANGKTKQDPILRIAVMSNGEKLMIQRGLAEVIEWDLVSNQSTSIYQRNGHRVTGSCVSSDGRTYLVSILDHGVMIFRDRALVVFEPYIDNLPPSIGVSANGQTAVCVSCGGKARCWNLSGVEPVQSDFTLQESPERIALDPMGGRLIVTSNQFGLKVYDVKTGRLEWTFADNFPAARDFAFSGNGEKFAVISLRSVALYEFGTGECQWINHTTATDNFLSVAISHDGNWVSVNSLAGGVEIFAGSNGAMYQHFAKSSFAYKLAFSPVNDLLFVGEIDGSILVWSLTSGRELRRIYPLDEHGD